MRRNLRAAAAVVAVLGGLMAIVPADVNAQKVANPGSFSIRALDGEIRVGTNGALPTLSLKPQEFAQCVNGIDDDGDGLIDAADNNCVPGPGGAPDDSELKGGYQPKVDVVITGSVAANGTVTVPAANIVFPESWISVGQLVPGAGLSGVITVKVAATTAATGTLNPLTGEATLDVRLKLSMSGDVNGAALNQFGHDCSVGTAANPIRLQLTTGIKGAIGSNPQMVGVPYDSSNDPVKGGTATMVDNAFVVPAATDCFSGLLDITGIINTQTGLGTQTVAGKNIARLVGKSTTVVAPAIKPAVVMTPGTAGPAPFAATFNAASSTVTKTPATYSWTFSNGGNGNGVQVNRTFTTPGPAWAEVRVSDGDGDSATKRFEFVVPAAPSTNSPPAADYDGDGDSDVTVFRPAAGAWFAQSGLNVGWGVQSDVPVTGDFNGDGKADPAVFRPSDRTWHVQANSGWGGLSTQWGNNGDVPVAADYNGDGITDIAVYRPSSQTWYVQPSASFPAGKATQWGATGDVPVPADYNGDKIVDIAVYRPSGQTWYVQPSASYPTGKATQWGATGDLPVPADYNGDGIDEVAVYRRSDRTWYSQSGLATQWGMSGDLAVPGDYDGDGDDDVAVFRPSNQTWYSQSGLATQWGASGDIAVIIPPAVRSMY